MLSPHFTWRYLLLEAHVKVDFDQKVIVVTGGASGIGRCLVIEYLKAGGSVACVDRDACKLNDLCASVPEYKNQLHGLSIDLTADGACQEAIADTINRFGRIDVLVNNAGANDSKDLNSSPREFRASLLANLEHYYGMTHFALPWLKQTRGCILNMSSKVAVVGQGGTSGYAAAKGAINALSRDWAIELAPFGIRVNALCPAEVLTPMYERWLSSQPPGTQQQIESAIPFENRFTSPAEIAHTALFVTSGLASHTTGQLLFVDGGYTHLDRRCTLPS